MLLSVTCILTFVPHLILPEMPLSSCLNKKPFKMTDNSCATFSDVCVKKGDRDCDLLQSACQQCLPSNMTIAGYLEIGNLKAQLNDTNVKIDNLAVRVEKSMAALVEKMKISAASENIDRQRIYTLLSFMIILSIGGLIVCLEIKFGFIERLLDRLKGNDNYNELNIREARRDLYKEESLQLGFSKFSGELENLSERLLDRIKGNDNYNELNIREDKGGCLMKFDVTGVTEPVKVYVCNDDSGVRVKRKICSRCRNIKTYDYKVMKLKFEEKYIDENQFLITSIGNRFVESVTVICEYDSTSISRDYSVIKVNSNIRVPNLIQIGKDKTIAELKRIFEKMISLDFSIYKASEELKDDQTIEICKLNENDYVSLVTREKRELNMYSMFDSTDTTLAQFSNTDNVSALKLKIANKYDSNYEEIFIFCDNKYLEEDSLIFEHNIQDDFQLRYCYFHSFKNIDINQQSLIAGDFSEIFEARDKLKNLDIIMKRYKSLADNNAGPLSPFLKELKAFNVTNDHNRFVKIFGVYESNGYIYVGMEKMKSSLKTFLEQNEPVDENQIEKWAMQMIEGLKHLHANGIIHGNIKPSNILLDDKANAKISSFCLSRHVFEARNDSVCCDLDPSFKNTIRFMAPEVKSKNAVGFNSDVWSFGAVLTEIVTCHDKRFKDENDMAKRFAQFCDIDTEKSKELKNFIGACLKSEIEFRASLKELLRHEFLKK